MNTTIPSTIFTDWVLLMQKLGRYISESEMAWILRVILAAAKSKRDLRRLHDQMTQENTRLSKEDFFAVENFWEKYFRRTVRVGGAFDEAQALLLLSPGNTKWSLEDYYIQLIESRAKKIYRGWDKIRYDGNKEFRLIYPNRSRWGRGEYHYIVHLFDEELKLSCSLNGAVVRARILLYGKFLTESLTHHVIHDLPTYDLGRFSWSTETGLHAELVYDLVDIEFPVAINSGFGGPLFLSRVVERLVELGVPITQSFPIE